MNTLNDLKDRFPGLSNGWARFDGPAGTQVVDTAIEAMSEWQRSGNNANSHGSFPASGECDALVERVSGTMSQLLGANPEGMVFGPSTTANMMALTRAVSKTLSPGDEIICTTLDHSANVSPWQIAAQEAGAQTRMAQMDGKTGRLPVEAVTDLLTSKTKWIAVSGGSNAIGTMPDISKITEIAHQNGTRVAVDGVHRTPHIKTDITGIGCDVYATSSYKWYGPHAGVLWITSDLLSDLPAYKIRPAPSEGSGRWQYGTPSWETLAGIEAAGQFLMEVGIENISEYEHKRFHRLLSGLYDMPKVRVAGVTGPDDVTDRAPTLMFLVEGLSPEDVAKHLAESQVAVWNGHNYALDAMEPLGLDQDQGAVRAGITAYITDDDVDRLLEAVSSL